MNRFTIFFLFLITVFAIKAQELSVVSFEQKLEPMTVPMQKTDAKGEICALIKVQMPVDGCKFEGNLVASDFDGWEYMVYLSPGSKQLTIDCADYKPLKIRFKDYGIPEVASKGIYELAIGGITKGITDGHEWVDLGLPSGTKWASCNVGANSPEEFGDYFMWIYDGKPKEGHYEDGQEPEIETPMITPDTDNATKNWGSNWHTPSKRDWEELKRECECKWTKLNGVTGLKVSSKKNGRYIFLPAVGDLINCWHIRDGGFYWTSTFKEILKVLDSWYSQSWTFGFDHEKIIIRNASQKYELPVRPITK